MALVYVYKVVDIFLQHVRGIGHCVKYANSRWIITAPLIGQLSISPINLEHNYYIIIIILKFVKKKIHAGTATCAPQTNYYIYNAITSINAC